MCVCDAKYLGAIVDGTQVGGLLLVEAVERVGCLERVHDGRLEDQAYLKERTAGQFV